MSASKATSDVPTSSSTPLDALAADDATRAQLSAWCGEVLALRSVAKDFDRQADEIFDDKVVPLLEQLGQRSSVAAPSWSLVRSKGRATLKPELLLMHGVSMATIEKSKVEGKPSWSLRAKDDKSEPSE